MKTILQILTAIFALVTSSRQLFSQWVHMEGSTGTVSCFVKSGTQFYCGTMGNGILLSTNGGTNWIQIGSSLPDKGIYSLAVIPNGEGGETILAGTLGCIYRSTDKGMNWFSVLNPPYETLDGPWVFHSLAINGQDIFAGASGRIAVDSSGVRGGIRYQNLGNVYLSTNSGMSWDKTRFDNGVTHLFSHSMKLYATGDGLFLSYDRGRNWWLVWSDLAGKAITDMLFGNTMDFAATGDGLYQSTDDGANWVSTSMKETCILSLAGNERKLCFVSGGNQSQNQIYVSTDIGAKWTSIDAYGFPHGDYFARAATVIMLDGDYIFAGREPVDYGDTIICGGVWRRALPEISTSIGSSANQLPVRFLLSQNYPNPFNPRTTIEYTLPQQSHVTVKIFDLLGCEVAVLVNEKKPAGRYELTWNADLMPSGVYFYTLSAGQFRDTKRMILLK